MKPQIVIIPKKPVSREVSDRRRIAETLFCSPEFATTNFQQMDIEDWKLHASRAWEVAEIFAAETKHRRK
jgi:hypothetical protein